MQWLRPWSVDVVFCGCPEYAFKKPARLFLGVVHRARKSASKSVTQESSVASRQGDRDRFGLATAPAFVVNAALHKRKYVESVARIERGILTNR
jgi:hypothetical protein